MLNDWVWVRCGCGGDVGTGGYVARCVVWSGCVVVWSGFGVGIQPVPYIYLTSVTSTILLQSPIVQPVHIYLNSVTSTILLQSPIVQSVPHISYFSHQSCSLSHTYLTSFINRTACPTFILLQSPIVQPVPHISYFRHQSACSTFILLQSPIVQPVPHIISYFRQQSACPT